MMTYTERLQICRDLARAVAWHSDCPERERAEAVQRILFYADELKRFERACRVM